MPKLHQIIERHWQRPNPFLPLLLKPLSKLFAKIAAKRRDDFVSGCLKSEKLPVPVVVVGNIHAGGTGKTPIVAALVSGLQEKGIKVGIISRGYGRKSKAVHVLNAASRAEDAGEETLLLFRKTGAPTAVGSSRAQAGRALLAAHPDIGLIVTDDGLQHYALRRDVEIAVFPVADTGRSDLDLLPNGSLREPLSRLDSVDAVVVSGGQADASFAPSENMFHSRIVALPDHADIAAADLPNADAVIITEKDAVKFSDDLNLNHVWVLPVCAIIEPDLSEFVLARLKKKQDAV